MIKYLLPAAVGFILAGSAASAAPLPSSAGLKQVGPSGFTEVQTRKKRVVRPRHYNRRYVPGRRYRAAPPGYRRYTVRPRDWRTRGCITVGPIWFCP